MRGTAGGGRVTVPYCCSTATASMSLVKLFLNAVASENSFFGMLDVKKKLMGLIFPISTRFEFNRSVNFV